MTLHSSKKEGSSFPQLIGSRAQVWHGTAYKTTGGLTKRDLMMSHGRIVSLKKHNTAKREKRLEKAGYFAKKGKFGFVKKSTKSRRTRSTRGGGLDDPGSPDNSENVSKTLDDPRSPDNYENVSTNPDETSQQTAGRRKRRTRRRLRGGKGILLNPSTFN